MAEGVASALRRAGPLAAEAPVSVMLLEAPLTRLSVRGGPVAAERLGTGFGVGLPRQALRAEEAADRAALWLGPDEWLLLAPEDASLARTVEAALAGEPGCVVDVSHRQLAIEIAGPGATAALAAGCPLDLHPSMFPVGMCTRTLLAKAEITLWRRGPDRFHLECWRSFAPYVFAVLQQAARDDAGW